MAEYATLVIGVMQLCAVRRDASADSKKNIDDSARVAANWKFIQKR
jgi:hypothetical protein